MRNLIAEAKAQYRELIEKAVKAAVSSGELPEGEIPEFIIEIPADTKNGNLASNVAMVSARAFHKAPRQIADAIAANLDLSGSYFEKAEVAGPGFLNVFYAPHWYSETVSAAITEKDDYGKSDEGKGKITDMFADKADIVIRFQGGANAGHTIINDYGKFAIHLLPSGVCHPEAVNIIGNGVALNIPV